MTDISVLRAEAAKARASASGSQRASLPCGEAQREDVKFVSTFRAELVEKDGQEFYLVEGYASMTEQPYEMWDMFGPYEEIVSKSAFDKTLASDPLVIFRFNHGGTSMANTRNHRLELEADTLGLKDRAWLNPKRADVTELITAIEDKDVSEQSFMFEIKDGEWNDDYTQFRINEVNLDRGDVGPVTYGANPYTLIASRAGEFLDAIPNMPVLAAREALTRLAQRSDIATPKGAKADAARFTEYLDKLAADKPADKSADPPADTAPPVAVPSEKTQGSAEEPVGKSIAMALVSLEIDKQQEAESKQ